MALSSAPASPRAAQAAQTWSSEVAGVDFTHGQLSSIFVRAVLVKGLHSQCHVVLSCACACEQRAHEDLPRLTPSLCSPLGRWGSAGAAQQAHTVLNLQRLQAHCFLATGFWAIWWRMRRAFVAGHRWRQVVVWRGLHAAGAESAGGSASGNGL